MPTFMLELKFNDQGVLEGVKRLQKFRNNAQDAENQIRDLGKQIDSLSRKAKQLAKAFGVGFGVHELNQLRKALTQAASEAEDTAGKFSLVFRDVKEAADAAAESLALDYGMSRQGAQAVLSTTGDLLIGFGVTAKEALKLSEQVAQLGTDLASFTNYAGGAEGAIDALTKALVGDTRMAKQLGVSLEDSKMEEYARSVGLVWSQLNLTEKAHLRLQAAIKQSPNAIGAFARDMGSYAAQAKMADAALKDFIVSLGQGLLPATTEVLKAINDNRAAIEELGKELGGSLGEALRYVTENFTEIVNTLEVAGVAYMTFRASQKLATLGFFDFLEGLAQGAKEAIQAQKALEGTEKALKKTTVAAKVAKTEVSLLGKGLKGLTNLFGGPWVIGITAATTALTYFLTQESAAEGYARKHADAMRLVSEDAEEAASAIEAYTEKLKRMSKEQLDLEVAAAAEELDKLASSSISLAADVATAFYHMGDSFDEYWKIREIVKPLEDVRNATREQITEMLKQLQVYATSTGQAGKYKEVFEEVLKAIASAVTNYDLLTERQRNNTGQMEKSADATTQAANATQKATENIDGLIAALNSLPNAIEFATPQDALTWLEKYTANTKRAKEQSEELTKQTAAAALVKLQEAAALAEANGQAKDAARIYQRLAEFQARIASGFDVPTKPLDDARRKAEEAKRTLKDLETQINRLKMTDKEFREWELTNRILPDLLEKTNGDTKAVKELEDAMRQAWADEEIKKGMEEAKENLQIQNDFYDQLIAKLKLYGIERKKIYQTEDKQDKVWEKAGVSEEDRALLREIQRLEESKLAWDGVKRAMMKYYADLEDEATLYENFTKNTLDTMTNAFVDFTMTGKLSFSDMANSIISDMVRIAYQTMVLRPLMQGVMSFFGGGLTGGGGGGGITPGITTEAVSSWMPWGTGFAKGGVLSGGSISDFSGQIVDRPTAFSYGRHLSAFAAGGGIMGEAGPEAILPLERGKNGQLGLAMSGMDDIMERAQRGFASETAKYMQFVAEQRAQVIQPQISIQINNNTGQQMKAEATTSPNGQGGFNVSVVIDQIEGAIVSRDRAGNSVLGNHLDRSRGLSRAGMLYR